MKKQFFLFVSLMIFTTTVSAQSEAYHTTTSHSTIQFRTDSTITKQTVGMAIDLLPPIVSASTGNLGYSAQVWYGYKKLRVRGVIAGFQMPDKLMGNDDFRDLKITATALIFDCFKNSNFEKWWMGAGFEMWNNTISSKIDNKHHTFIDYVATAGGGYIFKIYKNFYVEPWAALHYVLNNEKVSVGSSEYKTKTFQGEVSLKIGWYF